MSCWKDSDDSTLKHLHTAIAINSRYICLWIHTALWEQTCLRFKPQWNQQFLTDVQTQSLFCSFYINDGKTTKGTYVKQYLNYFLYCSWMHEPNRYEEAVRSKDIYNSVVFCIECGYSTTTLSINTTQKIIMDKVVISSVHPVFSASPLNQSWQQRACFHYDSDW